MFLLHHLSLPEQSEKQGNGCGGSRAQIRPPGSHRCLYISVRDNQYGAKVAMVAICCWIILAMTLATVAFAECQKDTIDRIEKGIVVTSTGHGAWVPQGDSGKGQDVIIDDPSFWLDDWDPDDEILICFRDRPPYPKNGADWVIINLSQDREWADARPLDPLHPQLPGDTWRDHLHNLAIAFGGLILLVFVLVLAVLIIGIATYAARHFILRFIRWYSADRPKIQ